MVGDDTCTSMSQTEGYREQISRFSKSRLIAGGLEGLLSCLPSLPLSPETGWLRCLGVPGLWCRGGSGPGAIPCLLQFLLPPTNFQGCREGIFSGKWIWDW